MKLIRSRLGEDFNAAVTQPVIFGRKWILIDADFTNGGLGRECAGRKPVYIDLAAVRACRWASQRLKFGLQLIGVIRQRFEVFALHDHHSGVVRRSNIDLRGRVRNLHLFFLNLNDETNIQLLSLPGEDLDAFLGENSEALGDGLQGIRARNQSFEFVQAVPVSGGVQ